MFKGQKCCVVGGAGFIGSHIVDRLIEEGAEVRVIDNMSSAEHGSINVKAEFYWADVRNLQSLENMLEGMDYVFLTAAIARTPWCIKDPILCYQVNVMGALNVLEAVRKNRDERFVLSSSKNKRIKRVVLSSSNVVYAFDTPYRTSKEAVERLADTYHKMYGMSTICLRYSNVYGKRQLETGESPNVFAALRKSKKENGKLIITGDGEQSRDYTHVSDIVEGNLKAALSDYCGTVDLCTGVNVTLNEVAKYFDCPVEYIEDRPGDVKHIKQDPAQAREILGWESKVKLADGIKDVL